MVNYKNYSVWQKSHSLVLKIYKELSSFPKEEQFNLISQIKRASLSIPTNIAEGCGRETQKELLRFLYISSGSAHELDYLILVSMKLGFISKEAADSLLDEIQEIKKMLASLINKIKLTL
ncbi:four helix bundle protein [Lutibacter sp. B1]|uniref:four helix bundle protein n=1 Tax=Lutibacter sp. B1 TaxID=2725996 RepID=UPI001456F55E|nr:four helix bundle protein [Lutibacter sp. B1]NLP56775.1 four helix bundle protein [Lutibacter sp. B1]